ncbi:hypothetical protein CLIM01_11730 [Colletotrichum limetticola]|uniref:Uncharacterized protein n=1 Tax=Colletotrichum limetticola TaxID=1209924 RepID=A0ABQ9PJ77_9PEZI|nr:hypothetical protein CLIM01_11730 [Colletotrichum limetticola]
MFYIWINRQFMRDKTRTWSAAAGPLAFGWGVKVSSSNGNSFDLPASHKFGHLVSGLLSAVAGKARYEIPRV